MSEYKNTIKKEVLKPAPLDFVLVGSGQVVDKYWLRSQIDGSANITDIISLEPERTFRQRNPDFAGTYHHSVSIDDTFTVLTSLAGEKGDLNIANVATTDIRLALTQKILQDPQFGNTRLFIEKPYALNHQDLELFTTLIEHYSSRLHFTEKYANGRADILYPYLPADRSPVKITGRLIEGTEYFRVIKDRIKSEGDHPYLHDGPELELGFHLLDIISVASKRFGGCEELQVREVYDLGQRIKDFEPGYGFGAILEMHTFSGNKILVDLQAGKADILTEKFIEFDYGDDVVGQEYTAGDPIDPVYELKMEEKK